MIDLGVPYNPAPEGPGDGRPARLQARYLAGLYSYAELGAVMRRQGAQIGMDRADRWIGLSDGANGLEDFLDGSFPRVEAVLLDFWHPAQYLGERANLLHPKEAEQAEATRKQWRRLLKEEGGATTAGVLREWDWPARPPALRAKVEEVVGYFGRNVHRMEYPEYLARG